MDAVTLGLAQADARKRYASPSQQGSAAAGLVVGPKKALTGRDCISYGEHLWRSRAKLAAAAYQPVNVLAVGNSITAGYYANTPGNEGSIEHAAFRSRSWIGQLRTRAARVFGQVGEGVILMNDPRVTTSGTQPPIGSTGITQSGGLRMSGAGQSVTLTLTVDQPATEIWVHGWWESNAKCAPPQVAVDGAAAITPGTVTTSLNPASSQAFSALGSDVDYTFKLQGLASGVHTVVLTPNATTPTAQIDVAGFSIFNTPDGKAFTSGIAFHRCGAPGGYIGTSFYPSSNTGANPRSNRLTLGRPNADLLILGFGVNESGINGDAAGWTPARYLTALQDIVDYATLTYGVDVLLVSLQHWAPSNVGTNGPGEQPYRNIHETMAATHSSGRVAHLDITRAIGHDTYANGNSAGWYQDTIHYKTIGHADTARLLWEALFAGVEGAPNVVPAGIDDRLLARKVYAPASLDQKSTTSTTLAVLDATNLTTGLFVAPASGAVKVTIRQAVYGPSSGTYAAAVALVAHGTSTQVGNTILINSGSTAWRYETFEFSVTGLTPGQTYQYDEAAGVTNAAATFYVSSLGSTGIGGSTSGPTTIEVRSV